MDKLFDTFIKEQAKKYNLSESIIEDCINHTFKEIKNSMGREDFPNILIHNLGSFKLNTRYMIYKIRGLYNYIKQNNPRLEYYDRALLYIETLKRKSIENNLSFLEELNNMEAELKILYNNKKKDEE